MRLCRVVIRNFKSIDHIDFKIPETNDARPGSADFLSIVGKNNVGKSTILQAIQAACPGGATKLSEDCFPNCAPDPKRCPEVELHFDNISKQDRQQHAIGSHIISEGYSIMKRWLAPNTNPTYQVFEPLFDYRPDPETFNTFADCRADSQWNHVLSKYEQIHGAVNDTKKLKVPDRDNLKKLAKEIGSPVAVRGEADWKPNPGGIPSNLDSVLPEVISVHAVQESKEVTDSSKKTSPLARIIRRIFETSLVNHATVAAYEDAAKSLQALFSGDSRDDIVADIENKINGRVRELIDLVPQLGFAPPDIAINFVNSTELRFSDANTNASVAPQHHGHGAQRAIIISLLQVLSEIDGFGGRPLLFLIEEPEIYLHPEMCRKMRDALVRIARRGMAQVICTTHSPTFLDLADRHDGILLLRRDEGKLSYHQKPTELFSGPRASDRRDRLRMILNFDASVNEVFFTDRVALVEGDTEIAALDAIGRKLSDSKEIDETEYNIRRRALKVVNCRGKWTIVSFQQVLNAFSVPYVVVHDADPGKPEAAEANDHILANLSDDKSRRRIHSPDFEMQHFGKAVKKDKPWAAYRNISEQAALSQNLREFFEFMLQCRIGELKKAAKADKSIGSSNRRPKKRPPLPHIDVDPSLLTPCSLVEALSIDGANVIAIETIDPSGFIYKHNEYGEVLIARAQGNNLQSPFLKDCVVVLKRENFTLPRRQDTQTRINLRDFSKHIKHESIHLTAINDKIHHGRYCVRRVRTEQIVGGGWNCRIKLDRRVKSPDGDVVIRHDDTVHFLAEVIATTTLPLGASTRSYGNAVQIELPLTGISNNDTWNPAQ